MDRRSAIMRQPIRALLYSAPRSYPLTTDPKIKQDGKAALIKDRPRFNVGHFFLFSQFRLSPKIRGCRAEDSPSARRLTFKASSR